MRLFSMTRRQKARAAGFDIELPMCLRENYIPYSWRSHISGGTADFFTQGIKKQFEEQLSRYWFCITGRHCGHVPSIEKRLMINGAFTGLVGHGFEPLQETRVSGYTSTTFKLFKAPISIIRDLLAPAGTGGPQCVVHVRT